MRVGAIVSSMWPEIGVSARVYYTAGDTDERLHAITDTKVVVYGADNSGGTDGQFARPGITASCVPSV